MPIHLMWCAYMAELMSLPPQPAPREDGKHPKAQIPNSEGMQSKLVKADLNGGIIKGKSIPSDSLPCFVSLSLSPVKQSRNTSVIGCEGIVIHETENTFRLVTKKNALKGTSVFCRCHSYADTQFQSYQKKTLSFQSLCLFTPLRH